MIVSAVLFLALASINLAAIPLGFGRHIENVPGDTLLEQLQSIEHVLYHNFVSLLLICLSICLAKLSIIATLLDIFNGKTMNLMRSVLWTTSLVVVLCCAAQFLFVIFQCTTVRLSWMVSELGTLGSCSNLETAMAVTGAINALTDFLITCAPIPSFMNLQIPLKQRLCLSALFLSGLVLVFPPPTPSQCSPKTRMILVGSQTDHSVSSACIIGLIRVVSVQGMGSTFTAIDATCMFNSNQQFSV